MPLYVAEYCSFSTDLPGQLDMAIDQLRVRENIVPQHQNSFALRTADSGISCPGGATMLIFKNGQVVDQIVGAVPRQTIAARLGAQL